MLKDIQKEVDDLKKTLLPLLGNERTNFLRYLKTYVYVYCEISEDNKRILRLKQSKASLQEKIKILGGGVWSESGDWVNDLKLSDERMFAFDLKNVLYYGRCKDKEKISTFVRYQNSLNKGTTPPDSQVGISSSLGFVSSVKNTRESLEKIFNIEKDT